MLEQILIGLFWYLSYGVIWSIYCMVSTLIHPSYPNMGFTPMKWVKHTVLAIVTWPYLMVGALMKMKEEAKKYK